MSFRKVFGFGIPFALVAFAAPIAAQDTQRFASFLPAALPQTQVDQWFADEVSKRSGGKLKVQVFAGGALGKPTELLKLVSEGGVQMATTSPAYFPSQLPLLAATNSLPLVFTDAAQAQRVIPALYADTPALQAELKQLGVRPVPGFWHTVDPYFMVCRTPIRTLADMKGKKVRSYGDDVPKMLQSIGAVPVNLLPGDLYESLQKGTVDCAPYSLGTAVSLKLHEVAKYVTFMNIGSPGGWPIFINEKAWDGLSADNKKLLTDVATAANKVELDKFAEADTEARKVMKAAGVEFIEFPDQKKFEAAAPDFLADWVARMDKAGKGPEATKMAQRWKELSK
jgi:TRAP-type C4-dicarboxylate transport system substrate-binding protein